MDLKSLLKSLKMNESRLSAIIGGLIIIIIGFMVVNYFRNLRPGTTTPTSETIEATPSTEKKYTVQEGDTLWSIALKEYNDGYQWTKIRDANNLKNANQLNAGQELTIPTIEVSASAKASPTTAVTPSATPTVVVKPSENQPTQNTTEAITGDTYTVVKGDSLWKIAIRAYGDGYKWTEIAKANKLVNPSLIHPGNVFTLPR
jgi:nucleoid-associated protein YgaU